MAAFILAQVPDSHVAASIAGDEFTLIWVDDDIVHGHAVRVVSLDMTAAGVPDFHSACDSFLAIV